LRRNEKENGGKDICLEEAEAAAIIGSEEESLGNKYVRTVLDELEAGTNETMQLDFEGKVGKNKLPEGVSSMSLYTDVFKIAWPALVENALASLVSMVDMMMVGGLGSWAISAVGLAIQPRFIFMTMIMSMSTGATALIARARGAMDHERVNSVLKHALILTLFIAVIGSIAGYIFSEPLIRFMGAGGMSEETILHGTNYLKIQMAGFSFMAFTSVITASFRGTGNSRISMVYNIMANVVNVVFNWLLIGGNLGFPEMGVEGASLATIIGQMVATGMAFYCILNKKHYLKLTSYRGFKIDKSIFSGISAVGLPAMGEQMVMRVGMILFSRIIAALGETDNAIHQICMNIQSISFMVGQGFAVSATSLVGQSLGKKRGDMAEQYSLRCRRMGLVVSLALMLVFAAFGKQLVGMYNNETEVVALGAKIMLFVAILQPIQCSQFVLSGALRGAGDTKTTAVISLITVLFLRPILGYSLVNGLGIGLFGAWVSIGIDQCLRSALVMFRYNTGKWKLKKI
jgi:putative MATE family efflux protein